MLGSCWAHIGLMLGSCWGYVGTMLEHLGILGAVWEYLASLCCENCEFRKSAKSVICITLLVGWSFQVGAMLGLCWAYVGAMLGYVGPCWAS